MMHDWVLVSVFVDWNDGKAILTFKNEKSDFVLYVAENLLDLKISKLEEWGPSISINEAFGPTLLHTGNYSFELEMQSGDRIFLEAKSIFMQKSPSM